VIVERRVVVLSRTGRLGTLAVQALGHTRSLACLESPIDLADWARPPVDVVLMDFPRRDRGIVYRQLRQRYRGPVLALLDSGDEGGGLPEGRGPLATLQRPFSGDELSEVLGALLAPSTPPPAKVPAPPEASAPAVAPAPAVARAAPAMAPPAGPAPQVARATAPPAGPAPQVAPAMAPPAGPAAPMPPPPQVPPPVPPRVTPQVPPPVALPAPPPEPRPVARPPEAAARVPASAPPPEAVTERRRSARWSLLGRLRLRRWQVAAGAAAIVLLALSFGAPRGCGSRCAGVAGAVESGTPGGLVPDFGVTADPPTGSGPSAGPTTGTQVPPGVPGTTSALGGLLTSVGSTGVASMLISPAGGMGGTGSLLPTSSAAGAPPPTTGATPTTPPSATQPPATAPPQTSPPTTAPPPTSPPTTAPPPTNPPTTAPPPTDPPTTAPPPTEPPTTAAPPPPPPPPP
jgi:hypothetical protein